LSKYLSMAAVYQDRDSISRGFQESKEKGTAGEGILPAGCQHLCVISAF
jgi:hypothetical protein